MKLIVGLGNPGYEYHLTPHNLGFMAVDRLAESCGARISRPEAQALTADAQLEQVDVVLAKPQTFMNLSGLAVARLLKKYEIESEDLIVLVDDVDLPLGTIRIRGRGSAGSHNGLKSLIGALESDRFVRVRMGIGPDHPVGDRASYVLGRFRKADLETVAEMLERATAAVATILRDGLEEAMNRYNRRPPSQ
ncbi:MAG: aminoacyl-tRNA hydrolase [Acidobacteria bacterium]|nr:MAG: aminoacyl-tRNA hydrolase [Acidobacteriota bacterium]